MRASKLASGNGSAGLAPRRASPSGQSRRRHVGPPLAEHRLGEVDAHHVGRGRRADCRATPAVPDATSSTRPGAPPMTWLTISWRQRRFCPNDNSSANRS